MKTDIIKWSTLIFSALLVGCDPAFNVDYEVMNSSGNSITIFIDQSGFRRDTNTIADDTRIVFLNQSTICCTTKEYLNKLQVLPFEISIVNSTGLPYNKDASAISNWSKIYPDKSGSAGRVQLIIRPDDFD